jgi:sugar lactone lactonase YvrE
MSKRAALTLLVVLSLAAVTQAQSIIPFAGGGTPDGQAAKDIKTPAPRGIAFDKAGNVYIVVSHAGEVLKVDSAGIVKTFAGNGGAGYGGDDGAAVTATLNNPEGIVFDAADNLYIADTENNRIRRVDAKSGVITTYAGGGTPMEGIGDGGAATAASLGSPWGLAIDRGFLYITEQAYNAERVRRVNMTSGMIDTIAGATDGSRGSSSGDNGPAKDARFIEPLGIAADAAGNLYIADHGNGTIRRIDTGGTITTYAGGGPAGNIADGIPATQADLTTGTIALAFDPAGNLLVDASPGVRRIDRTTHTIATAVDGISLIYHMAVDTSGTLYWSDGTYGMVFRATAAAKHFDFDSQAFAGLGSFTGDGRLATAALLDAPQGLALDSAGNLYIADAGGNTVRRVSAADGTISTFAGGVGRAYSFDQEGFAATDAAVGFPEDVEVDAAGNLYIADQLNGRVWRVDTAGKITTYAGGGSPADRVGDDGPATGAVIYPNGLGLDRAGNLYIADGYAYDTPPHHRIRVVDAQTKKIFTIAGGEKAGFAGDNGAAKQALIDTPRDVAVDKDGNIFIADYVNAAIRRIDHVSGNITTIAGHVGDGDPLGDGGPATSARLTPLHMAFDRLGIDLYVADSSSDRIRKIDTTGTITTVAGSGQTSLEGDFAGDNGPATAAKLNIADSSSGVALNPAGDLFLSDSDNNRVRAVLACRNVGAPQLSAPANGATGVSTAARLSWNTVAGAFRYDVLLDTTNPPAPSKLAASDVDESSVTLSNLQPNMRYFWQVAAKGDRFCPTTAKGTSAVASFVTSAVCGAGAFDLLAPADKATGIGSPVHLTWQASGGTSTYDLYLGASNPPPLSVSGIRQTSFDAQITGDAFWFVVAHADCDATKTLTSSIRSFNTIPSGACATTPSLALAAPAANAVDVPTTLDLTWNGSGPIDSYDVYFGASTPPPLVRSGLSASAQSFSVPSLSNNTTYYWRVVMNSACLPSMSFSTPVQSFTTRAECRPPGAPTILFAPVSTSGGATYAIVWSQAPGIGSDGGYLVERSLSPNFSPILDSQVTSSTAASFLAGSTGTIYHRVRGLAGCNPDAPGDASSVKSVSVANAPPNVIFTVPPQALVTALGEKLESRLGSFTLENIGPAPVQAIVGRQELGGSPPFFSIVEDAAFVTLEPRTPRTFTIRYSGPPNDVARSYEGVIFVSATGQGVVAVTPYAFVNLKVGGVAASVPQFLVDGIPADYVAFDGFSGDDANRPPRQIAIRNNGTAPMELAAEIAPEVWLAPATGWNTQALAPNASRTIDLVTQRSRAPNGSPLPRYTYFTVRTKDGASARLLVQDNDRLAVSPGRATSLDSTTTSFIVPEVVSRNSPRGNRLVTRMRLTNLGGDTVQAEVIFTPAGSDGFDASSVKRAVVVVPSNDVVTITDPIVQLFRLAAPATGQIEVRLPRERVGLVAVRCAIIALGVPGGFETPVVTRGDGARLNRPHDIYLLPSSSVSLTLAETSGNDGATARVALIDDGGNTISAFGQQLPRNGMTRFDNLTASRIRIVVDAGGGSVIGLATIASATGESGAAIVSQPADVTVNSAMAMAAGRRTVPAGGTAVVTTVVPIVHPVNSLTKVSVGFLGLPTSATDFLVTLRNSAGLSQISRKLSLSAGASRVYGDLLGEFFNMPNVPGSVFIDAPAGARVYAVMGSGATAATPTSSIALPTSLSEAITAATFSSMRPLSFDGLEQSTDPTRGDRWLLALNEVSGNSGRVMVRLYEAANRTSPIAQKEFGLVAYQQLTLDTVFAELGLDTTTRRKDRANVQVVVSATNGNARVAASAISMNAQTGEARSFALVPAVGSGVPSVTLVTPITPQSTQTPRRRAVKH